MESCHPGSVTCWGSGGRSEIINKMKEVSQIQEKHESFFPGTPLDFRYFTQFYHTKSAESFEISSTFGNEWKDFPKNPPSGGGNVDPMDVPAVLEIFSTSEGRWFVGLVVKQVGENGWMVWMVRLKKTSKTGTPKVWALVFFFWVCEYFFGGRVFWEGEG